MDYSAAKELSTCDKWYQSRIPPVGELSRRKTYGLPSPIREESESPGQNMLRQSAALDLLLG